MSGPKIRRDMEQVSENRAPGIESRLRSGLPDDIKESNFLFFSLSRTDSSQEANQKGHLAKQEKEKNISLSGICNKVSHKKLDELELIASPSRARKPLEKKYYLAKSPELKTPLLKKMPTNSTDSLVLERLISLSESPLAIDKNVNRRPASPLKLSLEIQTLNRPTNLIQFEQNSYRSLNIESSGPEIEENSFSHDCSHQFEKSAEEKKTGLFSIKPIFERTTAQTGFRRKSQPKQRIGTYSQGVLLDSNYALALNSIQRTEFGTRRSDLLSLPCDYLNCFSTLLNIKPASNSRQAFAQCLPMLRCKSSASKNSNYKSQLQLVNSLRHINLSYSGPQSQAIHSTLLNLEGRIHGLMGLAMKLHSPFLKGIRKHSLPTNFPDQRINRHYSNKFASLIHLKPVEGIVQFDALTSICLLDFLLTHSRVVQELENFLNTRRTTLAYSYARFFCVFHEEFIKGQFKFSSKQRTSFSDFFVSATQACFWLMIRNLKLEWHYHISDELFKKCFQELVHAKFAQISRLSKVVAESIDAIIAQI